MAKRRDPKANRPVAPPKSREDEAPTETPDEQPTFGSEGGAGSYHGGPTAEGPVKKGERERLRRPDPALS